MRNQVIILEDNDDRQQHMLARLRDRLPPCPVVFFKSAHDMLSYLAENLSSARVISLDNDLERLADDDPDPGAGRDVAAFLATQCPTCPIVIHSTNTHASLAMEAELQDAGWQVARVTPYEDLAWIDREWFWAIRDALLMLGKDPAAIPADTLLAAQEFIARAGGVAQAKAAFEHLAGLPLTSSK